MSPIFVPKQNKLNCDLTYELEERIVESSPLYKRYRQKRRKKKGSSAVTSLNTSSSNNVLVDEAVYELTTSFTEYNRFNLS